MLDGTHPYQGLRPNFRVVPATETDILVSTHHPTHSEMRSLNNNQLQAFCLLHAENIGVVVLYGFRIRSLETQIRFDLIVANDFFFT